jgi:perosamine synthetase
LRRTCIVNNDFSFSRLLTALSPWAGLQLPVFEVQLAKFLRADKCYLTSCGFTALQVILRSFIELRPGKTEVILPAYTAPGLILPIRRLGLTPRLCDISLESFNMDPSKLSGVLTKNTLAVIAVDMFGIPADVEAIRAAVGKDVLIIDDCAQALGSERNGVKTGSRADIGFGSFGRGKNFSLYGGGFIAINSPELAEAIENNYSLLSTPSHITQIKAMVKFFIFSFLTSPFVYAISSPILSRLKSTHEQEGYTAAMMGPVIKTIAKRVFSRWLETYTKRINNGIAACEAFFGDDGLTLPRADESSKTAFNRFPLLVKSLKRRTEIVTLLNKENIEASPMYNKPVHLLWDIGYRAEDFPAAEYLAEHLVTLPIHGQVTEKDIDVIADVLRKTRSSDLGEK